MKRIPLRGVLYAHWSGRGGWREVLVVAMPLVLSTCSVSVLHFVDRMFLAWYAQEALAAAVPAGLFAFTIASFFVGTVGFANTFVAQYQGAQREDRIGPSVWQATWFAVATGLVVAAVTPWFAGPLFRWLDHAPGVQACEIPYFRIMCLNGFWTIVSAALSAFYSGRGKTQPIMWVNLGVMVLNILLNYAWIFGHWGFPRAGIVGAGWATFVSTGAGTIAFLVLFWLPGNRKRYQTLSGWHFQGDLFRRLMRFGLPAGSQFFLDMAAFSLFIALVGRIGTDALAATNLSLQINLLAFLPMIGFGIAISTLVGNALGEDRPQIAVRATWSALQMLVLYIVIWCALFAFFPGWFIDPFGAHGDPEAFARVRPVAINLLRFVVAYTFFDMLLVIFSSALKGAGDTRFVMYWQVGLAWVLMVLPTWLLARPGASIYVPWIWLTIYVISVALGLGVRFLLGGWQDLRVIEQPAAPALGSEQFPASEAP